MLESDREVGRVVAELRGERTQQSVADAMRELGWPWSQATVWSVEKGERPLKLREAVVLAAILGTSVETFVGVDPDLVLLSNKLTHVHGEIAAHKQQIAALEQQLAEKRAELARSQQERLSLEDAFRAGAAAHSSRDERALLAHLSHSVEHLVDEHQDEHWKI
jgi:hypothetical protein